MGVGWNDGRGYRATDVRHPKDMQPETGMRYFIKDFSTIPSKVLKWCVLSTAMVFILGWLFVWLVVSGSDDTTVYTENDFSTTTC